MRIAITYFSELAKEPKKAYPSDACYDVVATSKTDLGDGRILYKLGFGLGLPQGYRADFRARSSVHQTGLVLSNCIGTGDQNFIGEYRAIFYHVIPTLPAYEIGDRILQMHIEQVRDVYFAPVWELAPTDRGSNGIGSTGNR